MSLARFRYLVVEGPIGAGKTSLAKRLAEHLGADTLMESATDNPFLPRFYQDPRRYALATQLHFLFDRVRQVKELAQGDLFRSTLVADFLLDKDKLFARLNLDEDEYQLYRRVFDDLSLHAPAPDLVVYLQAPVEVLQARIRQRGIDYERGMGADYLRRLAALYSDFFHHYDAAPVLMVNSENLNFVKQTADFELLLERIAKMRGAREFFSKAGT